MQIGHQVSPAVNVSIRLIEQLSAFLIYAKYVSSCNNEDVLNIVLSGNRIDYSIASHFCTSFSSNCLKLLPYTDTPPSSDVHKRL